MHSLLEQGCAGAVDIGLDIVPDEASIDLAAALIAEAGRTGPALPSEPAEIVSSAGSPAARFTVDDLAQHRPALLRFARRKVRDEALAEDAAQDTLLVAVSNCAGFRGQSSLRTWLIGILNHKIHDVLGARRDMPRFMVATRSRTRLIVLGSMASMKPRIRSRLSQVHEWGLRLSVKSRICHPT